MPDQQDNNPDSQSIEPTNNGENNQNLINQANTPPPFQSAPPFQQYGGMGQANLPNATAVLVMGILSIPACCCYGFGIIFGIIAWVLATGDIKKYNLNPNAYSQSSYKNAKAGKVCGIIGAVLSFLYIACLIAFVAFVGWGALKDPQLMKEIFEQKGLK